MKIKISEKSLTKAFCQNVHLSAKVFGDEENRSYDSNGRSAAFGNEKSSRSQKYKSGYENSIVVENGQGKEEIYSSTTWHYAYTG